jgi:hypothetical protein
MQHALKLSIYDVQTKQDVSNIPVVLPTDEDFDRYFEEIVKPALKTLMRIS